jgi:hypothetical protein
VRVDWFFFSAMPACEFRMRSDAKSEGFRTASCTCTPRRRASTS